MGGVLVVFRGLLPMRSLFVSIVLLFATISHAQEFDWAYEAGGVGLDVGRAVASDDDGNVIMVGSFSGDASFGDTALSGLGGPDGFIGKYTSEGQLLWMRSINGPAEDLVRGVTTDPDGNIYVTGHFTNWAYVYLTETDTVKLIAEGGKDVFIVKYSPDGELIWAERAGGPADDTGTDIIWHSHGKIIVSGGFQGRATFANVSMLAVGLTDAFVLLMYPDGNSVWVRRGGGPQHDVAASVSYDRVSGDIYITGDFFGSALFGNTTIYAAGSSDVFLAKYSGYGELQWVVSHGSTNLDVATKVGCDIMGHVYVAGQYQGVTQFGAHYASSRGYNDVFVAKFNMQNGNVVWLRSMGGTDLETCQGLLVDWDGTTYTTGMFDSRLIADQDTLYGQEYDIFIACLESSGHTRYLKSAGAGSADIPMGICFGKNESLFITGFFYYFAMFDAITIGNAINGDVFLARLTDIVGVDEAEGIVRGKQCLGYDAYQRSIWSDCDMKGPWQVVDVSGRIVMQGGMAKRTVDLSGLKAGYYLFSTSDHNSRAVLPFVVQ